MTRFPRGRKARAFALLGVLAIVLATLAAVDLLKPTDQPPPNFRSMYVAMPDGVRIAVDVWLPPDARVRSKLPAVLEPDRYWRARAYQGGITDNPNYWAAEPWNQRGYAYIYADLRGTGASFGTVGAELGTDMIADVGALADWIAGQRWSDGRVGLTGVSYSADVAMLALYLRNNHITAVAPISYDFDPYEDLLRPGGVLVEPVAARYATILQILDRAGGTGCATSAHTRQICEQDGLAGTSPEPVQGADGPALLDAARAQHFGNVNLIDFAAAGMFRDYSRGQQSWAVTSVGSHLPAIKAGGVPILTLTGWLDAATAQGALSQFTSLSNTQDDWIGPWSHGPCCSPGEGYIADPFKPSRSMTSAEHQRLDDLLYAFFDRYVKRPGRPGGGRLLHYYTLNQGTWRTTSRWPVAGTQVRPLYLSSGHLLNGNPPPAGPRSASDVLRLNPAAGTGALDRWHTNFTGGPVVYPDRSSVDRKLLTYTSIPLRQTTLVTGNPEVTLQVTGVDGASNGALYAYLEDVSPGGRVTYITEGDLALADRAQVPVQDNPPWRTLLVPRTYDRAQASPFPAGKSEPVTFDLLPISVLFRRGDRIRLAIAAADPSSFQLLPPDGQASYLIGHRATAPSVLDLPVIGACSACGS